MLLALIIMPNKAPSVQDDEAFVNYSFVLFAPLRNSNIFLNILSNNLLTIYSINGGNIFDVFKYGKYCSFHVR